MSAGDSQANEADGSLLQESGGTRDDTTATMPLVDSSGFPFHASSSNTVASTSVPLPDDDPSSPWEGTWREFLRALRSSRQPFNPFEWIYRLALAAVAQVLYMTGLQHRGGCTKPYWRAIIPLFAIFLIVSVVFSYVASIRNNALKPRWCSNNNNDDSSLDRNSNDACMSLYVHDGIVAYLATMILYFYCKTVFQSPGVFLPHNDNENDNDEIYWTALKAQGGWLGWDVGKPDLQAEKRRVALFQRTTAATTTPPLQNNSGMKKSSFMKDPNDAFMSLECKPILSSSTTPEPALPQTSTRTIYIPPLDNSVCYRCRASSSDAIQGASSTRVVVRPVRCRHCSTCNRCILQYDHHCVWLNQCIGYNNYRSFVLILLYLTLGCTYGVVILFHAFYEPLRDRMKTEGFRWLYNNGTGVLDLPSPFRLLTMILSGQGVPVKIVIDMVYPLLLGVGCLLAAFLGQHVQYILTARTTLEHKMYLEHQIFVLQRQQQEGSQASLAAAAAKERIVNAFDQGNWYKNLTQSLGPNLWLILLPIHVEPPKPYLPPQVLLHNRTLLLPPLQNPNSSFATSDSDSKKLQ